MWKKKKSKVDNASNPMDVEELFNKHFTFEDTNYAGSKTVEDILGNFESHVIEWKDMELLSLKDDMNALKDQLSGKDIESWHAHTTKHNIAGKIIPYVKSLNVELCTQAWVKFYEIVTAHNIVPDQDFVSLHLCEAPGAFISALNHYLQQQAFPHKWIWRGTTLNPYCESNSLGEMIADDRLIRTTYPQWYFGPDGSGDIRAKGHIEGLCRIAKSIKTQEDIDVLLITADGSRDCQENPAEQESLLSQLHLVETLAACLMLDQHGSFVLKVFTMLEASAIGLMFLLNIMFKEVHAFKPATSKSGNSECYLVCLDYRKDVQEHTLRKMLKAVLDDSTTCFVERSSIPEGFMEIHRTCCKQFAHWQMETIRSNLDLFGNTSHESNRMLQEKQDLAVDEFISQTKLDTGRYVKRLATSPQHREVFRYGKRKYCSTFDWQHKVLKGTFQLRQHLNSMSFEEKLSLMEPREVASPDLSLICHQPLFDSEVVNWQELEKMSHLKSIRNSRLCEYSVLDDANFMLKNSQVVSCQQENYVSHVAMLTQLLSRALTFVKTHSTLHERSQGHGHLHKKTWGSRTENEGGHRLTSSQRDHFHNTSPRSDRFQYKHHTPESQVEQIEDGTLTQSLTQQHTRYTDQVGTHETLKSHGEHTKKFQQSFPSFDGRTFPSREQSGCSEGTFHPREELGCEKHTHSNLQSKNEPKISHSGVKASKDTPQNLCQKAPVLQCFCGGKEEQKSKLFESFGECLQERWTTEFIQWDDDKCPALESTSSCDAFFCNVTSFCNPCFNQIDPSTFEEVGNWRNVINRIRRILVFLESKEKNGCCLILLMTPFVTRFCSGLLYILARTFAKTCILSEPNVWMHQMVVLEDFQGVSHELLDFLAHVENLLEQGEQEKAAVDLHIAELVKVTQLLNDRKFVNFVTGYNNYIVSGFVNGMLSWHKSKKR